MIYRRIILYDVYAHACSQECEESSTNVSPKSAIRHAVDSRKRTVQHLGIFFCYEKPEHLIQGAIVISYKIDDIVVYCTLLISSYIIFIKTLNMSSRMHALVDNCCRSSDLAAETF